MEFKITGNKQGMQLRFFELSITQCPLKETPAGLKGNLGYAV